MSNQAMPGAPSAPHSFLPNFCANEAVFLVILVAELLAIILALMATRELSHFWLDLGQISLFIQWVALGATALLCAAEPWLARLSVSSAALVAFALSQLATLLFSLLGQLGLAWLGYATRFDWNNSELYAVLRSLAISSIVFLVLLRYFYIQHQWKQHVEAEARAQLRALQARIRPHFLFNSLNTIASLIYAKPAQAEEATLDLADLFRSTLQERDRIALSEELEIVRRYLRLESLRLSERLRVRWQLDERLPLALPIPALILQPLVENAVYHGVQACVDGGEVDIAAEVNGDVLRFSIANPLPESAAPARRRGNSMAQDNIRHRLALAYGSLGSLTVDESRGRYCVTLTIPRQAVS